MMQEERNDDATSNPARVSVTIMDTAQNKFHLSVSPSATIATLKLLGQAVHSVAPDQQRLICMGKLLEDGKTLQDYVSTDTALIQLFPKPTVVLSDDAHRRRTELQNNPNRMESNGDEARALNSNISAHVPQIVMESREVYDSQSNLILTTHEAYESLHRVRLLSFLALIYCSIQLMHDVSIWLAPNQKASSPQIYPPGDPTDTSIPGTNDYDEDLPQWENRDYIEIAICILGVYVANLGMKSTQEIRLQMVQRYVYLLGFFGTSWIVYLYYCYVDQLSSRETEDNIPNYAVYTDALFAITLPTFLFGMFFLRALQYYFIVREASQDIDRRQEALTSALMRQEHPEIGMNIYTRNSNSEEIQNQGDGVIDRMQQRNHTQNEYDLEMQVDEERNII